MIQALFYKEWIKTRQVIFLSIILFAGFITYTFIDIAQMFRLNRPETIWSSIILKDIYLISNVQWLPLVAGTVLSIAQYVPEIINKRLKLTLHLPLQDGTIVTWMLSYGFFVLLTLFTITIATLLIGLNTYFPNEFILSSFYTSIPWFMAGFTAYFLTAWIILEPVWKYRVSFIMISICTLILYFFDGKSGAYIPFIPYLLIIMVMSIYFPFYSVIRFKEGAL